MGIRQGIGDRDAPAHDACNALLLLDHFRRVSAACGIRIGAPLRDPLGEALASHILHGDERHAVVGAGFVDRTDALVVEVGGHLGFTEEALELVALEGAHPQHQLECDPSPQPDVLGVVDDALAALGRSHAGRRNGQRSSCPLAPSSRRSRVRPLSPWPAAVRSNSWRLLVVDRVFETREPTVVDLSVRQLARPQIGDHDVEDRSAQGLAGLAHATNGPPGKLVDSGSIVERHGRILLCELVTSKTGSAVRPRVR